LLPLKGAKLAQKFRLKSKIIFFYLSSDWNVENILIKLPLHLKGLFRAKSKGKIQNFLKKIFSLHIKGLFLTFMGVKIFIFSVKIFTPHLKWRFSGKTWWSKPKIFLKTQKGKQNKSTRLVREDFKLNNQ